MKKIFLLVLAGMFALALLVSPVVTRVQAQTAPVQQLQNMLLDLLRQLAGLQKQLDTMPTQVLAPITVQRSGGKVTLEGTGFVKYVSQVHIWDANGNFMTNLSPDEVDAAGKWLIFTFPANYATGRYSVKVIKTGQSSAEVKELTFIEVVSGVKAPATTSYGKLFLSLLSYPQPASPTEDRILTVATPNVTMMAFKLSSQNEPIKVTRLGLAAVSGDNLMNTVKNIRLREGSASGRVIASTPSFDSCDYTKCTAIFQANDNLFTNPIPTAGLTVYVTADIGGRGEAKIGSSFRFRISSDDITAKGVASGLPVGDFGFSGTVSVVGTTYISPQRVRIEGVSPAAGSQISVGANAGLTVGVFKVINEGSAPIYFGGKTDTVFRQGGSATPIITGESFYTLHVSEQNGAANDTSIVWGKSKTGQSGASSSIVFDLTGTADGNNIDGGSYRYLTIKTNSPSFYNDTYRISVGGLGDLPYYVKESELGYDANKNYVVGTTVSDEVALGYAEGRPVLGAVIVKDGIKLDPVASTVGQSINLRMVSASEVALFDVNKQFKLNFCVDGNASVNDIKKTNGKVTRFPLGYYIYDEQKNPRWYTPAEMNNMWSPLKNGACASPAIVISEEAYNLYKKSGQIVFYLDSDRLIAETNENDNEAIVKVAVSGENSTGAVSVSTVKVWPGDLNNDGIVDERDTLLLGIYRHVRGPARVPASTEWAAWDAVAWTDPKATYADANGDGVVDDKDMDVITLNLKKMKEGGQIRPSHPAFLGDPAGCTLDSATKQCAVSFKVGGSSDPDGKDIMYLWALNKGATQIKNWQNDKNVWTPNGEEYTVSQTFTEPGTYTFYLAATDRGGLWDFQWGDSGNPQSRRVVVQDAPAPAPAQTQSRPTHPAFLDVPTGCTLDSATKQCSVSFRIGNSSDPDGSEVYYFWALNKGAAQIKNWYNKTNAWTPNGGDYTISEAFTEPGTYTFFIAAADKSGLWDFQWGDSGYPQSRSITVTDSASSALNVPNLYASILDVLKAKLQELGGLFSRLISKIGGKDDDAATQSGKIFDVTEGDFRTLFPIADDMYSEVSSYAFDDVTGDGAKDLSILWSQKAGSDASKRYYVFTRDAGVADLGCGAYAEHPPVVFGRESEAMIQSAKGRFRETCESTGLKVLYVDVSGKPYSANKWLKVISPNGGESFKPGDLMTIKWDSNGVEKIRVSVCYGPTYSCEAVSHKLDASLRSVQWKVPSAWSSLNGGYVVFIEDIGSFVKDESDREFTIEKGGVRDWSVYKNKEYGFSVQYPPGWIVLDRFTTKKRIVFGRTDKLGVGGYDGEWFVRVNDVQFNVVEAEMNSTGSQFNDRQSDTQAITVNGLWAKKGIVTTPSNPGWVSETVFIPHPTDINITYIISNGAVPNDLFDDFYGSFQLLEGGKSAS